jgi:uncharacterized protein YjbI with pentapeptide repeats
MGKPEQKDERPKDERRFSQEQYDMLKRCSEKKDMTEWNAWREKNDYRDVKLEGGDFSGWYLKEVNLETYRQDGCRTAEVFLSKANFDKANLEKAKLPSSHVESARFHEAHLEYANLIFAHLDKAFLLGAHLEGACLIGAELPSACICNAHLNRSNFVDSHLQGSEFDHACLIGAKFQKARVSGLTSFCYCEVDRETDFREVGLDSVRINPATKQLLEYNIRRMNWEEWYKKHPKLKWVVKPFWLMSDYGLSTGRIVAVFLGVALVFANIYYHWGRIAPPGIIKNLFGIVQASGEVVAVPLWLVPLRAFYFSIITMTLGFSDMYANAQSIWGHILITVQALLGYVLLGALVTRFAVLFTAGGPAGKFANETKATEGIEKNGFPPARE